MHGQTAIYIKKIIGVWENQLWICAWEWWCYHTATQCAWYRIYGYCLTSSMSFRAIRNPCHSYQYLIRCSLMETPICVVYLLEMLSAVLIQRMTSKTMELVFRYPLWRWNLNTYPCRRRGRSLTTIVISMSRRDRNDILCTSKKMQHGKG